MIGRNQVLNYRMLGKISCILGLILLTSCVTQQPGTTITETPLPISETRKVISTIIGPPRSISENGREMLSQYYDSYGLDFDPSKSKDRYYSHILILNDRRPYDIRVVVNVEE